MRRSTITLADVAREAGVAKMTASVVVNGARSGTQVSQATRERILDAARRLEYRPNAVARGLSGRRMNTIGVVLYNPHARLQRDPNACGLLDGIIAVANARGQNTTLFTGRHWSDAAHSLPVFCDGRTDGLVILYPSLKSDIVPALLQVQVPFVLIGSPNDDPRVSSVDIDHRAPMEALVGHVLKQGHRRLAFLSGPEESPSSHERHEGYRRALAAAGVAYDPLLSVAGFHSPASGYERTQHLLELPPGQRPTAICCASDEIAKGALRALQDRGVRVPEEMSLTGFDDMPDVATLLPPLTTVHQSFEGLGRRAAEILLECIEAGAPLGVKELLPTEIMLRDSVASPPDTASQTTHQRSVL